MPRKCDASGCNYPVFAMDRNTRKRYCKSHQWKRTDKNSKPLKKTPVKKVSQKRSSRTDEEKQWPLFMSIWRSREHVSWISGEPLGDTPEPIFFFHVLPKGSYKGSELDPENIILTTGEEHTDWHSKPKSELLDQDQRWQKVFDLYDELKRKHYDSRRIPKFE